MIDINKLHPAIRERTVKFLAGAKEKQIDLRLTFGMRTFAEQQILFNQGRTTPGSIVTKARPGESFHNYGLAIDVIPFLKSEIIVGGKLVIKYKPDWNTRLWPTISTLGKLNGFEWGGDWKTIVDRPHFQYPVNTSYRALLKLKAAGHVDKDGFVIL